LIVGTLGGSPIFAGNRQRMAGMLSPDHYVIPATGMGAVWNESSHAKQRRNGRHATRETLRHVRDHEDDG
jgi:hypothetical protein